MTRCYFVTDEGLKANLNFIATTDTGTGIIIDDYYIHLDQNRLSYV